MIRSALIALTLLVAAETLPAQQPSEPNQQPAPQQSYLYKASLVQAAPGKLIELIDAYRKIFAEQTKITGDAAPYWMRHSQGDRWDLLILSPMASYSEFYKPDRTVKRETVLDPWRERLKDDIAWQEDVFVYGPPVEEVRKAFAAAGLFHVEMFQSLPGKQTALYKQREMENAFSHAVKAPENFIFVRDQGAAWDLFTIGCYENLKHYAQSADVPAADAEAAAKAAGFESAAQIGPYLRTLIALHRDTLAVAIK
ncbi:MAG: hypothetical protein WB987_02925 [Candidatus Acidiferrales bacterium]